MKSLFAIAVFALVSGNAIAVESTTVTLDVKGMTCATCPLTVKQVLKKQPGVSEAGVDFKTHTALVRFDPEKVQPEQLANAVSAIGFPATVKK